MEKFIPDGETSHKNCIDDLKESDIVVFLISPHYGSLIEICELKDNCKADDCPMKMGFENCLKEDCPMRPEIESCPADDCPMKISYTHCEYKTTLAEGIPHQTYKVLEGWDAPDVQNDPLKMKFEQEIGKKMWTPIKDIEDPKVVTMIGEHLERNIIKWYTQGKLDFKQFVDREKVLKEIIENIDSKVELWGVGGVGKTALIELALLIQKLKGKRILTIGTSKAYASGSGFEYFRTKCKDEQYIAASHSEITIYDVINAFAKKGLLPNVEEIFKAVIKSFTENNLEPNAKEIIKKIIEILSNKIRSEEDLILFIDDFHLANDDVVEMVKSVDHIILSSRKNTYIARKEIYLSGIDEEDREDLIKLFSTEIPGKVRRLINQIAEGHPVSTELLVKNYENIDFDKLKGLNLEDADDEQVMDFYKRVIEEIFSNNAQALVLLRDLAILNTDLLTNINRECVLKSYDIENIRKVFKNLVDTGMLKKREGQEGTYEFYFKHIQDALENIADKESQEKAIEYYEKKEEVIGENIDDAVEILYHKVKSNPTEELVDEILEIKKKIQPVHYGFQRLIDVGEELIVLVEEEHTAPILVVLGVLYYDLGRFEEAENAYKEALGIYIELADKYPDVFNREVAMIQNNFGRLYGNLGRFEEAENAYEEALEIYKELADKNPDMYNPDVAMGQNNLGVLYQKLGRFEEAETAFTEALEIRKKLADKNPDAYRSYVAGTQNNLGVLYDDLGRFEEAENAYKEALEIYKELADKNPDAYRSYVAMGQNNLGVLYANLGRFEEVEHHLEIGISVLGMNILKLVFLF